MRKKKAVINIFGSVSLQLVTVICGFIVPRLIIGAYGSDVNGIINSATNFLNYITLLDAGVGGVVRAALYKPLAEGNYIKVSGVLRSAEIFFRRICAVFVLYAVVLSCFFPYLIDEKFKWSFTASLVIIIALSTVSQYYFGVTYQVLLQADQKRYISSFAQLFTLVLNCILVVICIKFGTSVHIMKLVSSLVFFFRPIAINIYVHKKYPLIKKAEPDKDALKQRWDGLGHHLAFFIHENTDVFLLTVFSKISDSFSIAEVSVYSVYYSITYGIGKLSNMLHQAVEAAFGNMIAKNERKIFEYNFKIYEQASFMLTTFLFTCLGILIVPFMSVYMKGVSDANYIRPAFAYVLIAAEAMYAIRMPYNNVTLAAGHYRQTRNGAFVEAAINIVASLIFIIKLGITGVALGTFLAMTFRTVQYASYLYKNILYQKNMLPFLIKFFINSAAAAGGIACSAFIPSNGVTTYLSWFVFAAEVAVICFAWVLGINFLFYKKEVKALLLTCKKTFMGFAKRKA